MLLVPEVEYRMWGDGYLNVLLSFYGRVSSVEAALRAYRIHGNNHFYSTSVSTDNFRTTVRLQLQNQALLIQRANALGYKVRPDLVRRNYVHLQMRLASLRLDRQEHPVSEDRPLRLVP